MNSKVRFDFKSIKFRLWMYFVCFGIGVVILIWLLQIFFLSYSYETMKTKEVNRVAASVSRAYQQGDENLTNSIQELSISNDFYVMMESDAGYLFFSPENESHLPVYTYMAHAPKLKSLLESSHKIPVSFKINNGMEKYSTLAYGCVLDSTPGKEIYLYIFSPLYPVTSTVNILKNQLLYVTFITLILGFIPVSYTHL